MPPGVDAGVLLDTDIIVAQDLNLLWDEFACFNSRQLLGMVPVCEYRPHTRAYLGSQYSEGSD